MKTLFEMSLENDHLIAKIGSRRALIDTGGPTTFGLGEPIEICGTTYAISDQFMGMTVGELSRYLDMEIDLLLGADILSLHLVTFDLSSCTLQFEESGSRIEKGEIIPVREVMGIPIIDIEVGGKQRAVFFDTGAALSYLESSITYSCDGEGVVDDFYPGFGEFTTETYCLSYSVGGHQADELFGNLPDELGLLLYLDSGVVGILGNSLCRSGRVLLDTRAGKMFYMGWENAL